MRSAQPFALSNGLTRRHASCNRRSSGGGGSGSVETSRELPKTKSMLLSSNSLPLGQQEQYEFMSPHKSQYRVVRKLQKLSPASREKGLLRDNDPSIQTRSADPRLTKVINQRAIGLLEPTANRTGPTHSIPGGK